MKTYSSLPLIFILALILFSCQKKQPAPLPQSLQEVLRRGDLIMCGGDEFGQVAFALPCNYSVRETFNLAISLLHSFEYEEAEKAFVKVMDADPNCAMAYWGVAMSLYTALWAPPDAEKLKKGSEVLRLAQALPKGEKEQDYLDAIGAYYADWQQVDAKTRASRFEQKMEGIYKKYPNDTEAAIFYALALDATADPTDTTYAQQRKAGGILEPIFKAKPNHPGVAHYIIHSYDYPALAERALPIARKYADIAPASAHAQHMPSHIFTRLGLWDEAIQSNKDAAASAICYAERAGYEGNWDEELHSLDYLVYAYLQNGDNQLAEQQRDYLNRIEKVYAPNFKVAYVLAAVPARIALENKDWEAAAALEVSKMAFPWENFPWQRAILHFTRALGAVHLGNTDQARQEIKAMDTLRQQLLAQKKTYEADQVLVQWKAAQAWLHFAEGDAQSALALMHEAADLEDHTAKHPVTPGEVLPARELLGDLYLALGQPDEALKAYELDLKTHPNRRNGLLGAALAGKQLGMKKKIEIRDVR